MTATDIGIQYDGFNLKREASPLATRHRGNSGSAADRFNLKREASPLATWRIAPICNPFARFQSQARSQSPSDHTDSYPYLLCSGRFNLKREASPLATMREA